jgi:hypothetical protein
MSRQRKQALALVGIVAISLAGAALWRFWTGPRVTRMNFERVVIGMNEAEVAALLGPEEAPFAPGGVPDAGRYQWKMWAEDSGREFNETYFVGFQGGRAATKVILYLPGKQQ